MRNQQPIIDAQPAAETTDSNRFPTVGIAMPTVDNSEQACQAMQAFFASYPGRIVFSVVANGSSQAHLDALRDFSEAHPDNVLLNELSDNRGYGMGCNVGLEALCRMEGIEFFGVTNDDVMPASTCLPEMVQAMLELEEMALKPGLIGPVSNNINGPQSRQIGEYVNPEQLEAQAARWYAEHHESVTATIQLRGLFFLIHPDCLHSIGGFDTRFGIGNFEDDDYNLRAKLAGFTVWIADGAFLHHYGSTTFQKLGIDYRANIERNAETFMRKWKLGRLEAWPQIDAIPEGTSLYCPLGLPDESSALRVKVNGESVDLIEQASDVEFAAWLINALAQRPRSDRRAIAACVKALSEAA